MEGSVEFYKPEIHQVVGDGYLNEPIRVDQDVHQIRGHVSHLEYIWISHTITLLPLLPANDIRNTDSSPVTPKKLLPSAENELASRLIYGYGTGVH